MFFRVENLTKRIGGVIALKNVSFTVKRGEMYGLIGPNGSGKTTLFNVVMGHLRSDGGKIIFEDEDISEKNIHEIARSGIGRTFQIPKPFKSLDVLSNVMVGALVKERDEDEARGAALKCLKTVGITAEKQQSPGGLGVADLKKLELARTLALKPKLLLLDEVMGGLNLREIEDMLDVIKDINDRGITMIIVEHVMKAIMPICKHILVLNFGEKIAEGTPREISNNEKVISAYLGGKFAEEEK